jgi:hypothetical protein
MTAIGAASRIVLEGQADKINPVNETSASTNASQNRPEVLLLINTHYNEKPADDSFLPDENFHLLAVIINLNMQRGIRGNRLVEHADRIT